MFSSATMPPHTKITHILSSLKKIEWINGIFRKRSCVSSAGTASISPLTSSAFRRANVPSSASSDIDVSTAPSTGAPTCSS
eukprot:1386681-Amphidinium_carterae.1